MEPPPSQAIVTSTKSFQIEEDGQDKAVNEWYYDATCPNLARIVRYGVRMAIANDTRMAASLLRLHFHDCIVTGCDGSLLLDDTSTFKGQKMRWAIRIQSEGTRSSTTSSPLWRQLAHPLFLVQTVTLAAREAVNLAAGPFWAVPLGRRDGTTASDPNAVLGQLPSPFDPFENITSKFTSKGPTLKDLVVLSGAHTIGFARCFTFKNRLFDFDGSGNPDPSLDSSLLTSLKGLCPNQPNSDTTLVVFDSATPTRFDNNFYKSLLNNSVLLRTDQALMEDNTTASLVMGYCNYPYWFARDFGASMVKLASLGVLTGQHGEIRKNCRAVN